MAQKRKRADTRSGPTPPADELAAVLGHWPSATELELAAEIIEESLEVPAPPADDEGGASS